MGTRKFCHVVLCVCGTYDGISEMLAFNDSGLLFWWRIGDLDVMED
jgi:hypothetical protein